MAEKQLSLRLNAVIEQFIFVFGGYRRTA